MDAQKQSQWAGFLRKSQIAETTTDLATVITGIREFLIPVLAATATEGSFDLRWPAGGPWRA